MNPTKVELSALIYSEQVQPAIIEEIEESGTMYIGYPLPSCGATYEAKWLIKRVQETESNGVTTKTIMYANGVRAYNQKWDDRARLTYKYTEVF